MELAVLIGTAKQIQWADDIRERLIKEFKELKAGEEFSYEEIENLENKFISYTDSSWWIEHKHYDIFDLLES